MAATTRQVHESIKPKKRNAKQKQTTRKKEKGEEQRSEVKDGCSSPCEVVAVLVVTRQTFFPGNLCPELS